MLPRKLRVRTELVMAALSAVLGALTMVRRDWIEAVFGVDPDGGSGAAEWLVAASCFALSIALFSRALHDVRASRPEASGRAG